MEARQKPTVAPSASLEKDLQGIFQSQKRLAKTQRDQYALLKNMWNIRLRYEACGISEHALFTVTTLFFNFFKSFRDRT